ncbi:Peptidase family M13 [Aphelenchoides bicaudatus]|nr:Peptidase family M13 [Aphelenchoides bicaudatus]
MEKSARVPQEVKTKYFKNDPFIFIYTQEIFKQLDQIIKSTDKRIMANYLFTRYVVSNIPYLDSRFSAAGNRFAEQLDGFKRAPNRDQDCLDTITSNFPLVVDHLFIRKHFDGKAQESVAEMVEDLRSAMSDMITEEKWMQPSTKSAALKKLKKTRKVIAAVKDALNQKLLDQRYGDVKFDSKDSYRQMATKVVLNTARRLFMNVIRPEIYTYAETMRTTDIKCNEHPG